MFDLFSAALPLIFALPASAVIAPILGDDFQNLPAEKKFPFVVGSGLVVYIIFIVLHCWVHAWFAYHPLVSFFWVVVIAVVCLRALTSAPTSKTRGGPGIGWKQFWIFTVTMGLGIAAIANTMFASEKVFVFFDVEGESPPPQVKVIFENGSPKTYTTKGWCSRRYIILPEAAVSTIKKGIEAVGEGSAGSGEFNLIGALEEYSLSGYKATVMKVN